ncbi:MAG: elongation factor 4 [Deltaproteobacteria bacterium RIFCSPLOWO2_01_44_7]|nr:MAG: elongation factor 4 [Deltaproteobacteria bacterium RIFCSPHIGHO2_01_FULL_43_49]OGQ15541.1 MAG: elongation factor 4 [Deltaproteobacteria bacterium RIFCSPHIGHO2_02_FULL_44_53]OGQ28483.1 MAG: elongation factor 4 [Deltaproteobacteria bacterium RIFCSPHIGHO2_12_FULL_44_21]OGQ32347.1 MAG: elongation factor 4 [Deltaproteobacteria bacterium RIFCSPLOWO2_01_FULL_45_74]OGQ42537.1 MAG: elongation factor 4 [Deltaproteobacteria bacterium RIFCSPLOWO2_01_44_7]OGQ43989.1 MAG: elongation factor 4 [Deltapr
MDQSHIRNFCIIAHIDHGKSTLADRFLQKTGAISDRDMREQFLDQMDIERERGITIKAQTVRLKYIAKNGQEYQLNLIDTPGHVDFNYEVSRSLAACEGALLLVDATQGVEAQTVANALLAMEQKLELIPVINKVDLPSADPEKARKEIEEILALDATGAIEASGKTGKGMDEILEAIISHLPSPRGNPLASPRALIMDSWFDAYQGVIMLVRVVDGALKVNQEIHLVNVGKNFTVQKLGVFTPVAQPVNELQAGEVGFVIANIKEVRDTKIGDTITDTANPATKPLPGFKEIKPMVFAGLYPTDPDQYEDFKTALEKLRLNDSSFTFEPETSLALGFGFRCGFLGSLHMEIIQERLEREYQLSLITTAPTVVYEVKTTQGETITVDNPAKLPEVQFIDTILEPYAKAHIHAPATFVGPVLKLCESSRGMQEGIQYFGTERVLITYHIPFGEMMFGFHDQLKSVSKGYASLDYTITNYEPGDLIKLNILINSDPVDALSCIVHRDQAYYKGRELAAKLKELIPRQMFEIAIQAAIGNKVIARETVKALRKDVIAKCYGGDITRKRKLLEKQKEGKKRMKKVGSVEIPQEAFLSVLKVK